MHSGNPSGKVGQDSKTWVSDKMCKKVSRQCIVAMRSGNTSEKGEQDGRHGYGGISSNIVSNLFHSGCQSI
jgi:hypothetical protein